jgi:hypothetical protein
MGTFHETEEQDSLVVVPVAIHSLAFCLAIAVLFGLSSQRPDMVDLLVTVITVSGITASVGIAYLSMGRNADVFSEIVDALPYFLEVEAITIADLRSVALNNLGAPDIPTAEELDALAEFAKLKGASASAMPVDAKIRLIPKSLRSKYFRYFRNDRDQRTAQALVLFSGIPGVLCILALLNSYYRPPSNTVEIVENMLVITGVMTNLFAFFYFGLLSRARNTIQKSAGKRVRIICHSAHNASKRAEKDSAGIDVGTRLTLQNFVDEIKKSH